LVEERDVAEQRTKTLSPLPERWLRQLFPSHLSNSQGEPIPFAEHHQQLWAWVWSLQRGHRTPAFIAIWPRGGGKSSSAELACAAIAARGTRRYVLYVSATQPQADDHVQNVASLFESPDFSEAYPDVAQRRVGKYGSSLGWRRNRIRTASGFTVDAIGLDTASRGVKLESARPDLIVFDDIDDQGDSDTTVEKKLRTLTHTIIPTGSDDLAVLGIQNLQHPRSIFAGFAGLVQGRENILADRVVSGPVPAIKDLTTEEQQGRTVITGGEPTWANQDIPTCQALIDKIGITAFLAECQHEVSVLADQIFRPEWWADGRNRYLHPAPLTYGEVVETWIMVDSAMKDGQEHDFTAFGVWQVLSTGRLRFRELRTMKVQFPELITATEDIAADYYPSGLLRGVVIEDRVSGTSAAQTLRASARFPWLRSLIVPKVFPGSKPERGRVASPWCARNMIELPFPDDDVPWLIAFERNLYGFPAIPHDDDVDVFLMGILYLRNYLDLAWARQLASVGVAI
jgi:phage terminase large subunit-like protein